MTKEEALKFIAQSIKSDVDMAKVADALKALEQEPCEDWCEIPSYEMTLEQARQAVKDLRKKLMEYLEQEPTTKNDLGVEKIIDEIKEEFEKVDIPIMDKLTLFAKVQNSLYRCAELTKASEDSYNKGYTDGVKSVNICPHCGEYIGEEE